MSAGKLHLSTGGLSLHLHCQDNKEIDGSVSGENVQLSHQKTADTLPGIVESCHCGNQRFNLGYLSTFAAGGLKPWHQPFPVCTSARDGGAHLFIVIWSKPSATDLHERFVMPTLTWNQKSSTATICVHRRKGCRNRGHIRHLTGQISKCNHESTVWCKWLTEKTPNDSTLTLLSVLNLLIYWCFVWMKVWRYDR